MFGFFFGCCDVKQDITDEKDATSDREELFSYAYYSTWRTRENEDTKYCKSF